MTRRISKSVFLSGALASCFFAAGVGAAPNATEVTQSAGAPWALRVPEADRVAFKGVLTTDAAGGGPGFMLYPAPSAIVLAAGLLTHGLLNAGARSRERTKLEEQADKVLEPYQATLGQYKYPQLMAQAVGLVTAGGAGRLAGATEAFGIEAIGLDSVPVYSLTQDQTALVLDLPVNIFVAGNLSAPAYTNAIRVVSPAITAKDATAAWLAQEGKALKDESARVLARAIDLALRDQRGELVLANDAQKTVRYMQGSGERMERAQVITVNCDVVLLRTLRGGLMAVPPAASMVAHLPACAATKSEAKTADTAKVVDPVVVITPAAAEVSVAK